MPFPGLNIDNLPFFAVIAAVADGQTLIHDWVYENRAIYLVELNKLGGQVKLLDPHRVMVEGPTRWTGTEIVCPPALRPAVVDPAGDARLEGHLGAALDVRHPPRLRGPRRAAQPARRPDRDLPRPLTAQPGTRNEWTASARTERARPRPSLRERGSETAGPAPVVVLVEGASDAAVVRLLCAARGLTESAATYQVRDMGGVTNVGHHLRALHSESDRDAGDGVRVLGLYDAPEERFVVRALRRGVRRGRRPTTWRASASWSATATWRTS